jgi:hypothetical protein
LLRIHFGPRFFPDEADDSHPSTHCSLSGFAIGDRLTWKGDQNCRQLLVRNMSESSTQTIVVGADHGGFELKELLKKYLQQTCKVNVIDVGTHNSDRVDYPDYGILFRSIFSSQIIR